MSNPLLNIKQLSANAVVSNCLWMLGGGAGRTVVALCSNLVLVWRLLPEEFGRFALIQATIGLVAGVVNLRTSEVIVRASSQELESGGKDTLFSALAVESVLLGLGSVCLLWLTGLWGLWAGVLLCGTIAAKWAVIELGHYERSFHYKNLTLMEFCPYMLAHICVAGGAVLGIGYPVLYVLGLIETIGRFAGLVFVGGMVTFRLRWLRLHEWKALYRNFRGLWLDGWLEQFFERLVVLMIGWMAGEKAAGYFFQARWLATTPHNLIAPVAERVAYNYFSHRVASDRETRGLEQGLAVQLLFLGAVGIAVFFLAPPLIPMIMGAQWEPVTPLLQAMTGMILALSPFNTLKAFFMARNRMRPFILLGRGMQYAVLVGACLMMLAFPMPAAFVLAVALSTSYMLASIALFVFRRRLV